MDHWKKLQILALRKRTADSRKGRGRLPFFGRLIVWILLPATLGGAAVLATLAFLSRDDEHAPGLVGNKLRPCGSRPNCVCSEGGSGDSEIAPLTFRGDAGEAWEAAKKAIGAEGGKLRTETSDYVWATFSSNFFGFIDDLEIRIDADAECIHVRSASRVGYSDLGTNRARVESLRIALTESLSSGGGKTEWNASPKPE